MVFLRCQLDELTFSSNTEDFDRVWDAELDEEEDDEQEQQVLDTFGGFNFAQYCLLQYDLSPR